MAKKKFRMDSKMAGSILVAFLMLFSVLAVVADFFVQKEDELQDNYVGSLEGKDVYKVTEHDYYLRDTERGIELHFRSNPIKAKEVNMQTEADWMIGYLRQGPSGYLAAFYNTSKIGILMNPGEESRVITAATEITQALGYTGWSPSLIEAAFTSDSGRADIPTVTEKQAHESNDTMYFYLYTKPEENLTSIKYFGQIIYLQAPDYDSLDLATGKVKLRLFGYI